MSTVRSMQSHGRARPPGAWMLALLVLGAVLPGLARAADLRTGDAVVVGPQEVIDDDLYAFGDTVTVQGVVRGDVMAVARKVVLQGTVEGDVFSAASETEVTGPVRGSLRGASGDARLSVPVGRDVLLAGNRLSFLPGAEVAGDLLVAGNDVRVQSPVGGDVRAAAQSLTLAAPVTGSVRAETGTLRFEEGGRVGGDLRFSAQQEARIPQGAVAGQVERLPPGERDEPTGPLAFLFLWARSFFGLFALGLLIALLAPRLTARAPAVLREQPWKSLGLGVVAFVVTPLIAGLLFLVGLAVGGWWLGLFLLALYALALLSSFPVVGLLVGRWFLARFGKQGSPAVLALLVGVLLLTLARRVPIVGGLIALATMCFGLGALVLAIQRQRGPGGIPTAAPA